MHVSLLSRGSIKCHFSSSLYSDVNRRVINKVKYSISSRCCVYPPLNPSLSSRCQQSSSAMEQAAVVPEPPAEVNSALSEEKTAEKEAPEPGKRKSDEPHEAEGKERRKRRRGGGGKNLRRGERYIPPPQKRNPGVSFSQEHFDETSYYFEGGLRKVCPYFFDFKTYCKGRWIGKTLLEVFKSEFRTESIEYYEKAVKEGRIRLNETPVEDLSVVLRVSVACTHA